MYVRDDAQGRMDERRIRHDDGGLGRAGRIDGSMRWGIGGWAWSEGRGAADAQRTKDGKIERGEQMGGKRSEEGGGRKEEQGGSGKRGD
jgi:hypothetical protein